MSKSKISFNVELRERVGTGGSRAARREGLVPGVLYGGGEDPVAISLKRNEVLNADIERERLDMANALNIKTPYVVENGFGGIDEAKLTQSIEYLKVSMGLKGAVGPGDVFDASYLPPKEERMLP